MKRKIIPNQNLFKEKSEVNRPIWVTIISYCYS